MPEGVLHGKFAQLARCVHVVDHNNNCYCRSNFLAPRDGTIMWTRFPNLGAKSVRERVQSFHNVMVITHSNNVLYFRADCQEIFIITLTVLGISRDILVLSTVQYSTVPVQYSTVLYSTVLETTVLYRQCVGMRGIGPVAQTPAHSRPKAPSRGGDATTQPAASHELLELSLSHVALDRMTAWVAKPCCAPTGTAFTRATTQHKERVLSMRLRTRPMHTTSRELPLCIPNSHRHPADVLVHPLTAAPTRLGAHAPCPKAVDATVATVLVTESGSIDSPRGSQ